VREEKKTMKLSPSILLVASFQLSVTGSEVAFENELIKTEEIFDLVFAKESDVNAFSPFPTNTQCATTASSVQTGIL
jgi:hypothetical protein